MSSLTSSRWCDVIAKRALVGIAAVAAYVAVGLTTPGGPTRPLFDAIGPQQPYHWVNPPPLYADGNVMPQSATVPVRLGPRGSEAQSIATPESQAALIVKEGTFAPRTGETQVSVRIEPFDPATFGAPPREPGPPPRQLRYDGNAYTFTATYPRSKAEAGLTKAATVVLRFPILATKIFRRDGERWTDTGATPIGASLQIFGDTTALGTFVAVGPPLDEEGEEEKKSFPTALVVSVSAGVVAVAAAVVARLRARSRRRGRGRSVRTRPKPPPGPSGRGPSPRPR